MKQYTFHVYYPENRYIECYTGNKEEAIIVAQAERIRQGRDYKNFIRVECEFDDGWKEI
jgi:hypothetical protein